MTFDYWAIHPFSPLLIGSTAETEIIANEDRNLMIAFSPLLIGSTAETKVWDAQGKMKQWSFSPLLIGSTAETPTIGGDPLGRHRHFQSPFDRVNG